jgi:hypothetical protein
MVNPAAPASVRKRLRDIRWDMTLSFPYVGLVGWDKRMGKL